MLWRQEMDLPPMRCAGCVKTGGFQVETEEMSLEVATVFPELNFDPASREVGRWIEQPPCVPEGHPYMVRAKAAGRECPRVEMTPELYEAGNLAHLLLAGSTNAQAMLTTLPQKKARLTYLRAVHALSDPRVTAHIAAERARRDAEAGG